MLSFFDLIAILLVLTAAFGWINHLFIRLPHTIGLLVMGLAASLVLTNVLDLAWRFTFPVGAALLGLGVATFVGLIFGIYPARQASKKSPIEALRYE